MKIFELLNQDDLLTMLRKKLVADGYAVRPSASNPWIDIDGGKGDAARVFVDDKDEVTWCLILTKNNKPASTQFELSLEKVLALLKPFKLRTRVTEMLDQVSLCDFMTKMLMKAGYRVYPRDYPDELAIRISVEPEGYVRLLPVGDEWQAAVYGTHEMPRFVYLSHEEVLPWVQMQGGARNETT